MPRTVITGGAGFIGSHLTDRLLDQGHEVLCIDNLCTGREENVAHLRNHPRHRLLRQDVTEPIRLDGPVDFVCHLASPASPRDYMALSIQTLKAGSLGTHKALGLARAKKAVFLLASTSEVYGDPEVHPQPEDYWGHVNPVGPRAVYDEAKRFAEALTTAYRRTHGVDTKIVRIFNTYGTRMRADDGRALPNFIMQALRGEPLTIRGDGSQTRSFCFVSDLVEGLCRLLLSDLHDPVNLGNDEEVSIRDIAEEVVRVAGSASRLSFIEPLEDDPRVRRPDLRRARERLGWSPKVPRSEGLRATIAYFREAFPGAPTPPPSGRGGRTLTESTTLFGQVAIRKGYATSQQVEASLTLQDDLRRRGEPHKLIGMIMLEAGYLDTTQLIEVLKNMEQTRRPGLREIIPP